VDELGLGARRWGFAAALTGLLHVVFVGVGVGVIAGTTTPGLDGSLADVANYLRDANPGRVWAGEYGEVLGYGFFIVFAPYVWSAVRGVDAPAWLGGAVVGAATVYVALSMAGIAPIAPVLNRETDPVRAAGFLDLRVALYLIGLVFFVVWLVGVGAEALRTGALPAWLGWVAVALGVVQLVALPFGAANTVLAGSPSLVAFVWIVIVSVLLALRERRART
jgi:hypothetical protein